MEFKLGFHGHVGPCRTCRLGSDIFLVVYIYICMYIYIYVCGYAANLLLQVAACLVLCLLCFFACFGFWFENELNLLSPTTST